MESDSAPEEMTFEQARIQQVQQKKIITKNLEVQKSIKKQKKIDRVKTFNLKKSKIDNLFEEGHDVNISSNNLSQFTIVQQQQFDQSFQRNLEEKLPSKAMKQLKNKLTLTQKQESRPIILNGGNIHTVKNLSSKVTVENINQMRVNPIQNAKHAIDFLKKNIVDRVQHQRKSIRQIVGQRRIN